MNSENITYPDTAIIANGRFPDHPKPLSYLLNAKRVVCCDGAADSLIDFGLVPFAIVGDCDSVNKKIAEKYHDRLFKDEDQETNDLTKAVKWCSQRNYNDIVILGGTGKREDHTIGNISLLAEYVKEMNVIMVTDSGLFVPLNKSAFITSFRGQQVSLFSIDSATELTTSGLRYPLFRSRLKNWWVATLNESLGDTFSVEFSSGKVIVYLKFKD